MNQDVSYKEFFQTELSKPNKYRWSIIAWLIILTLGLLFTHKALSFVELAEVAAMTFIVGFFSYFDIAYFDKKRWNLIPDFIKIACLTVLVLIFGYWGLVYTTFYLIILIIDAFKYSLRDFISVIIMVAAGSFAVWLFQNDPVYQTDLFKNTFFLVMTNAIFALGIALRILARESLSLQRREKDLRQAHDILVKQNDEIAAVLNNMESAIFSLNKDNKINFANKSAIEMFPVLKGKPFYKTELGKILLADATGKPVTLTDLVVESDKKSYRSDLTANINGTILSFNALVTKIFDKNKNYDGAMISLHSLTADEMLEKSRMEFASLASHEIRTPLTVIEGYLFVMLNNKDFVYNDMTRDYLNTLHNTTSDLIKLSNGILSMSKIDEGSVRVDIEKTDLGELIKNAITDEAKNAKAKGLEIDRVINKVPVIYTDSVKVGEIIRNLLENAIKFSEKGKISVNLDQEGEEIIISVEDNGIGIPEESKDKIFSKFYQVENWDTRKNSGTGLGLYVSKSMARRIGGDLLLETTSDKGSKFSLILPVQYPNVEDLKKRKDRKLKEFIEGF